MGQFQLNLAQTSLGKGMIQDFLGKIKRNSKVFYFRTTWPIQSKATLGERDSTLNK